VTGTTTEGFLVGAHRVDRSDAVGEALQHHRQLGDRDVSSSASVSSGEPSDTTYMPTTNESRAQIW
jgi:hypothetical protein